MATAQSYPASTQAQDSPSSGSCSGARRGRARRWLGALLAGWLGIAVGCSSSPGSVGGTSGGGGNAGPTTITLTSSTGASSGTSSQGGSSGTAQTSTNGTCGSTISNTTRAQADVLLVLDRSDSMNWSLTADNTTCSSGSQPSNPRGGPSGGSTSNCTSRLSAVVPAIDTVVSANPGINWGLVLFLAPDGSDGSCLVDSTPQVPISADSAQAINATLASLTTALSTPTTAALNVATSYLKTVNDGNAKAILLATDGLPNCGAGSQSWQTDDMPGAQAAAAAAKAEGFPVYVIGIGPSVANLNSLAQSGGTGSYYPVTSTTELDNALDSIAQVVSATCTFKSNTVPPDKNQVYVYVDKNLVPQSSSAGWTFDSSDSTYATITLTGSYCDDMMSGKTSQVEIVFGCPDWTPPSIIP